MKTVNVFVGLVLVYVTANVFAFALSNIFIVGSVFEIFGLYIPPILIIPGLIAWQMAGRPKPVVTVILLMIVLLVAAVNIFFIWLAQS